MQLPTSLPTTHQQATRQNRSPQYAQAGHAQRMRMAAPVGESSEMVKREQARGTKILVIKMFST